MAITPGSQRAAAMMARAGIKIVRAQRQRKDINKKIYDFEQKVAKSLVDHKNGGGRKRPKARPARPQPSGRNKARK